MIWTHSIQSLLSQLFKCIYFTLLCEFRFQKLGIHQLLTLLTFNKKQSFNDIIMCKVTIYRSLFIDLPNTDTLIIRATCHDFTVCWNNDISDPFLMPMICTSVKSCAYFPKFNCFISWTWYQVIAIKYEVDETNIMIVTIESFTTNVVIIKVPKFYT